MKQHIVVARPPVYDRCVAVFGKDAIVGKPIVWSWADKIYNPEDIDIPCEIIAHEAVHGERQLGQVETWWERYLTEPHFRFSEELVAHRAEWREYMRRNRGKDCSEQLDFMAGRLASPLYGNLVDKHTARVNIMLRI